MINLKILKNTKCVNSAKNAKKYIKKLNHYQVINKNYLIWTKYALVHLFLHANPPKFTPKLKKKKKKYNLENDSFKKWILFI